MNVTLPSGNSQLKSDGTGIDEKHDGISIQPEQGFVIKSKSFLAITPSSAAAAAAAAAGGDSDHHVDASKVFINVCYHKSIEPIAPQTNLDANGKEVEGLNLPLAHHSIPFYLFSFLAVEVRMRWMFIDLVIISTIHNIAASHRIASHQVRKINGMVSKKMAPFCISSLSPGSVRTRQSVKRVPYLYLIAFTRSSGAIFSSP